MAPPRMSLALIGPGWPLRGGIAQYSTKLHEELARHHGVLHVSYSRQYPALLFPGKTQLDTSARPLRAPAVALLDSIGPWTWGRTVTAIVEAGATHAVIMWWHPFFAPCLGAVARGLSRRGIPSTFLCHNVVPHEGARFTRVLSRWALAPAHSFIVHGGDLKAALADLVPGPARIEVSPHPIYDQFGPVPDVAAAKAALKITTTRVLLFFGLIRAYKGVMTLIRAFAELAASDPDLTLVIAGECYEPEQPYRALISQLELDARVRFENRFIANEDVGNYFAAADVVTLPYHSASQSGVIPIAYAMDRPVVATRVGGLPEVVFEGETGYLVPPEDAPALAAAIRRVFAIGGRTAFLEGLSRHRGLFSWARMREVIEGLAQAPVCGP